MRLLPGDREVKHLSSVAASAPALARPPNPAHFHLLLSERKPWGAARDAPRLRGQSTERRGAPAGTPAPVTTRTDSGRAGNSRGLRGKGGRRGGAVSEPQGRGRRPHPDPAGCPSLFFARTPPIRLSTRPQAQPGNTPGTPAAHLDASASALPSPLLRSPSFTPAYRETYACALARPGRGKP